MKRTALFDRHMALGAKMVEFHGWEMPLEYSGIIKEHEAVRSAAGLFDVSHMGTIEVGGKDSERFLGRVLTFRPDTLAVNFAKYAFLLNDKGGIIDDLMVFRLNEDRFLLVVNASNTEKDLAWLRENAKGFEALPIDDSPDTAILALQGPASWEIAREAFGIEPASMKYHSFANSQFMDTGYILSKTGYTGEKGFEIYIHNHTVERLWDRLFEVGKAYGLMPCGLGARDTLRLEMGYLLHGSDADENTNPIEAGYEGAIDFGNEGFIGREALIKVRDAGPARSLVGLTLVDKGVPRSGCRILAHGREAGVVTSGNFSPMLKKGIALGYINTGAPREGLSIEIHDKPHEAVLTQLPFYKRGK
jgi:aminomethyltransferase